MKIGIVVYSQTGNTLSVAEKLKVKLESAGRQTVIERITLASDPKDIQNIRFNPLPDLAGYDALVFAAPVQAFGLCAVMKAYLPQMPALNGRKAACFTVKHWTSAWTGANSALKQLSAAVENKGGTVLGTGFVGFKSKQLGRDVKELVDKLAGLF